MFGNIEERKVEIKYDEEYLRKVSLLFDIKILALTLLKVIKKDGISH